MNEPLALIASVAIAIVAAALLHIVIDWVNITRKEKPKPNMTPSTNSKSFSTKSNTHSGNTES